MLRRKRVATGTILTGVAGEGDAPKSWLDYVWILCLVLWFTFWVVGVIVRSQIDECVRNQDCLDGQCIEKRCNCSADASAYRCDLNYSPTMNWADVVSMCFSGIGLVLFMRSALATTPSADVEVASGVKRTMHVLYAICFSCTMIFVSLASWRAIEATSCGGDAACVAFSICAAICGIVTVLAFCWLPVSNNSRTQNLKRPAPPEVKEKLLLSFVVMSGVAGATLFLFGLWCMRLGGGPCMGLMYASVACFSVFTFFVVVWSFKSR